MKLVSGKFKLDWVEGTDNVGRPVKYQSLVEVPVVEAVAEPDKYSCYHEWELYEGFLIREKKCLKCGEIVILNGSDT
jgi:uncharacterized protein (DUF983 family)